MRTAPTPAVPAVKDRRRHPGHRTGPVAAVLILAGACALAGATVRAVAASSLAPLAVTVATTPVPAPPHLEPLPVVVLAPAPAAPTPAAPTPAAVAAPTPPGQVTGVGAPSTGILPPVAVLPAPVQSPATAQSPVLLALLAGFVAILLAATVLTARRRL